MAVENDCIELAFLATRAFLGKQVIIRQPRSTRQGRGCPHLTPRYRANPSCTAKRLTPRHAPAYRQALGGGCSSAWLELQIVDLAVAGSNPVSHPKNLTVPVGLVPLPRTTHTEPGPAEARSVHPLPGWDIGAAGRVLTQRMAPAHAATHENSPLESELPVVLPDPRRDGRRRSALLR